jgi:tRNA pseudouridine13 synthase
LAALPDDLVGALDRCDPKVMQLYVAAFQSHLFNQTLIGMISARVPTDMLVPVGSKAGKLWFWRELPEDVFQDWAGLSLPLLAHDSDIGGFPGEVQAAVAMALEAEGMEISDLRVTGLRNVRLRGAVRPLMVRPADLDLVGPCDDDLNPGRLKLTVKFGLPKGAFATIVMKRLGLRGADEGGGAPAS